MCAEDILIYCHVCSTKKYPQNGVVFPKSVWCIFGISTNKSRFSELNIGMKKQIKQITHTHTQKSNSPGWITKKITSLILISACKKGGVLIERVTEIRVVWILGKLVFLNVNVSGIFLGFPYFPPFKVTNRRWTVVIICPGELRCLTRLVRWFVSNPSNQKHAHKIHVTGIFPD